MQKIKITTFLIGLLIGLGLLVKPVSAQITPEVSISKLPSYFNDNSFKLSYSAISSDPASITAQFYYRKESGSYTAFGPILSGASGQVEVTDSQVSEQTRYYFKVEISGDTDETSSIYDTSGPSPVTGYYKDSLGGTSFKIHWRNPNDADFARVMIYRGETVDFSADSNHEIATVLGSPDSDMTYDEHTPDQNKTYFYAIRAIDKAGNSSSLVGDGSTSTITVTPEPSQTGSSGVTQLPKEAAGQVLGEEDDDKLVGSTADETSLIDTIVEKVSSNKLFYIGLGLLVLAVMLFRIFKRYKNN